MALYLRPYLKSLSSRSTITCLSQQFAIFECPQKRQLNTATRNATFGLMFDIDGVLVRGKKVIPAAVKAFKKLVDHHEKFKIPVVFVTNAGGLLRSQKAQKLSETLGIKISEDQLVMAYSPLKILKEFHNKRVLVSGQGSLCEISKSLGFTNVCTVEDIQEAFPMLDVVDHRKLEKLNSLARKIDKSFPPIEAIVLMQEPVEWDSSLQLLIDVLMTNGNLLNVPSQVPYPHIPLIACNMDLQWMSEAWMPRFGHGAFLVCLEELYKKLTGKNLIYTELIGKPSLLTMKYADSIAQVHAQNLGFDGVKTIYFIGDNLNTDIFGANLYHQYLTQHQSNLTQSSLEATAYGMRCKPRILEYDANAAATECLSILVETGVHNASSVTDLDHTPRDFLGFDIGLKEPTYVAANVLEAIEIAFKRENFT